MFNSNINNRRKIVCDSLETKKLSATEIDLSGGSINPSVIGSSVGSITKLNTATASGINILDTSSTAQQKDGRMILSTSTSNDRELLKLRNTSTQANGDQVGIKLESDETDDITIYKAPTGLFINNETEGDQCKINNNIELFISGAKFIVGNSELTQNTLTLGGSTKTININSTTSSVLNIESDVISTIQFSGFRIEKKQTDATKLKITNSNGSSVLLSIDQNGRIGLGGNEPSNQYQLNMADNNGVLRLPHYTTIQRNALTATQGMMIYNSTLQSVQSYNGSTWSAAHLHEELDITHGTASPIVGISDTQTITNKVLSGTDNTISNIPDSSLSSNIVKRDAETAFSANISCPNLTVTNVVQCQSIRNLTPGTDSFEFLNDSSVKVASYSNGTGFFTSEFGFNVITGKDYMINSVPIQEVSQTLKNKTLDNTCVVSNGSLERGVIKSTSTINNPTVDDDIGDGYQELSLWNNSINNTCFVCVERFSGAAVWKKIMLDDTVLANEIDSTTSITTTNQITGGSLVVDTIAINGNEISTAVGDLSLNPTGALNVSGDIKINSTKVLTSQQGSIANASETTASNTTKINEILAAMRNHGLIDT